MRQINIDAVRAALKVLTDHTEDCPHMVPVERSQVAAAACALAAAVDELERAQPVVAIFEGKAWTKRGDEMCVYTTAEDIAAISLAVSV